MTLESMLILVTEKPKDTLQSWPTNTTASQPGWGAH